jgi:hypothetical protein
MSKKWLPGKRGEQLAMANKWIEILNAGTRDWGVPVVEITALDKFSVDAAAALAKAMSTERSPVVTAQCNEAFDALTGKMMFIKSHYFLTPPFSPADFVLFGLKGPGEKAGRIPPPRGQAEADISRPGVHLLKLHLHPATGSDPDPYLEDYGYRIYWGVMPPGGAAMEAAIGPKRELARPPVSGKELPYSRFTHRKNEFFDFDQEDSGKTVYFCIQYENSKGDQGPWGPIFFAVIP